MASASDNSPQRGSKSAGDGPTEPGRAAGGAGAGRAGPPPTPAAKERPAQPQPAAAKLPAEGAGAKPRAPGRKAADASSSPRPAKAKPAPDTSRRRADAKALPLRWQAVEGAVDSCLPRRADQFEQVGLRIESGARVQGDVCARQVHVYPNAAVVGSVLALERAEVQNASVEGSVVAGSIRSNGRSGPLLARSVELARGAEVHGDVHAGSVQLDGALQVSGVLVCDGAVQIPPGSRLGGVQAARVQLGRGCKLGFVKTEGVLKLEADVQVGVVEAAQLESTSSLFLGSVKLSGKEPLRIPQGSRIDVLSARGSVVVERECELGTLLTEGTVEVHADVEIGSILQASDNVTVHSGAAVREIVSAATVSLPADVSVESCYAGQGILGQEVELRVRADGEVVLEGEAAGRLHTRALSGELYRAYRSAGVEALRLPQLKRAAAEAAGPEDATAQSAAPLDEKPATPQESADA